MRVAIVMGLLSAACVGTAPPLKPGGPADPAAPEGPMASASPELTPDAGIGRYTEGGSTPSMGNMQMGGEKQRGDMKGMNMQGQPTDGGMEPDGGMR